MATPHVAGALALALSLDLTAEQVQPLRRPPLAARLLLPLLHPPSL